MAKKGHFSINPGMAIFGPKGPNMAISGYLGPNGPKRAIWGQIGPNRAISSINGPIWPYLAYLGHIGPKGPFIEESMLISMDLAHIRPLGPIPGAIFEGPGPDLVVLASTFRDMAQNGPLGPAGGPGAL